MRNEKKTYQQIGKALGRADSACSTRYSRIPDARRGATLARAPAPAAAASSGGGAADAVEVENDEASDKRVDDARDATQRESSDEVEISRDFNRNDKRRTERPATDRSEPTDLDDDEHAPNEDDNNGNESDGNDNAQPSRVRFPGLVAALRQGGLPADADQPAAAPAIEALPQRSTLSAAADVNEDQVYIDREDVRFGGAKTGASLRDHMMTSGIGRDEQGRDQEPESEFDSAFEAIAAAREEEDIEEVRNLDTEYWGFLWERPKFGNISWEPQAGVWRGLGSGDQDEEEGRQAQDERR